MEGYRTGSQEPLSPTLSLKGEGACPCREEEWFQLETFGAAG
jgi:hypothetical protein